MQINFIGGQTIALARLNKSLAAEAGRAVEKRPRGRNLLTVLGAMLIGLCTLTSQAQVVINEVMADNQGAVENGPDFPDFIELHNRSASAAAVGNFSITDDPALPRKFIIPDGTIIPAGGYLILWCDSNVTSPGLHTGFGLGANTDRVQLYGADGVSLLDDISFGIAVPNLSIGRIPNSTGSWTLTQPTPSDPNVQQPLGARTELNINEWMASPAAGEDWIEVYNASGLPVALGALILTDTATNTVPVNRPIPPLSFVGSHGYVQFFASNLEEADADHLDFRLGASGETLTLYESNGTTVIDRVTFGAQSANTSQGRAPDGSDNIVTFPAGIATPEAPNQTQITNVVISEVLSHTDPPLEDAIELQNVTGSTVDISHWWLSDSASSPQKYRIPAGTTIAPYGFKVFYQYQFDVAPNGFSLDSVGGDEVYLSVGDAAGQLTGQQTFVKFGPLRNGVSAGRYQTSRGIDFVVLSNRTFGVDNPTSLLQFRGGTGLSNALPRVGPVVISEIHFSPLDTPETGGDDDEFVELHNPGTSTAFLYDVDFPTNAWRLRDGVSFNFPTNLSIPAGGYLLVVNFDPVVDTATLDAFRSRFGVPVSVPIFGPYEGQLSNSGETIRLSQPDHPETSGPSQGFVPYELLEAVEYSALAPWPTGAAGTGSSLHRSRLLGYGNEPTNWFVAAPTPGRADAADADADGMPDDWELTYNFNPNSSADAALDADGDGASNLAEFRAGTNPRSGQSVFRIQSIRSLGGVAELRFSAVAGTSYEVQSRPDVASGNWLTISNIAPPGVSGDITVNVPLAGSTGFYRVIVSGRP